MMNAFQVHPPPADTAGMKPSLRSLTAVATSLALVLAPVAAVAESRFAGNEPTASAALDFRIIIPAVMRVIENDHPMQLAPDADGAVSAQQRLTVLSNMKHGFCVSLRVAAPVAGGWRLDAAPEPGVRLEPAGDGYRLCSARPGRYQLVLQHRFSVAGSPADPTSGLAWPVQTDITAI